MSRILRVPPSLDKFFRPLHGYFHWDDCTYFHLLVVTIAVMWGRRNVANLYRIWTLSTTGAVSTTSFWSSGRFPRRPSARKLGTASGSPPGAWGDSLSDPR